MHLNPYKNFQHKRNWNITVSIQEDGDGLSKLNHVAEDPWTHSEPFNCSGHYTLCKSSISATQELTVNRRSETSSQSWNTEFGKCVVDVWWERRESDLTCYGGHFPTEGELCSYAVKVCWKDLQCLWCSTYILYPWSYLIFTKIQQSPLLFFILS